MVSVRVSGGLVFSVVLFIRLAPIRGRATLFPYTTLLRSRENALLRSRRRLLASQGAGLASLSGAAAQEGALARDRKSTRLNSSHGYISYAVFCLKKKKLTKVMLPSRQTHCRLSDHYLVQI